MNERTQKPGRARFALVRGPDGVCGNPGGLRSVRRLCGSLLETGLPAWIRPALGGIEIVAAVLFLLPVTTVVGGYALLGIFLFAAALHVIHRWYDISGLVLYAMAVLVTLAHPLKCADVPTGDLP